MHKPWEVLPDIDSLNHQLVPHFTSSTPHGPLLPLGEHAMGSTLHALCTKEDPARPASNTRAELASLGTAIDSGHISSCVSGSSQQHCSAQGNQSSARAALQPGPSLLRGQVGESHAKRGPGRPRKKLEPSDVLRPMFVREAPGNDDGTGSVDSASLLPPCTNSSAPLRSQEAANPSSNDRKPDSAAANQRVHPSEDAPESCVGKQLKALAQEHGTAGPSLELKKDMLERGVKRPWRFNICNSAPFMDLLPPGHGCTSAQKSLLNVEKYKEQAPSTSGDTGMAQCAQNATLPRAPVSRSGPEATSGHETPFSDEPQAEEAAAAFIAALANLSRELACGMPDASDSVGAHAQNGGLHAGCADMPGGGVTLPDNKSAEGGELPGSQMIPGDCGSDVAQQSSCCRTPLPASSTIEKASVLDNEKVDIVATIHLRPRCTRDGAFTKIKEADESSLQAACSSGSARPGQLQSLSQHLVQPVTQRQALTNVHSAPRLLQSSSTCPRTLEHHGSAGLLGRGSLHASKLTDCGHAPSVEPPMSNAPSTMEQAGESSPLSALAELRRLAESSPVIYNCSPSPTTLIGAQDTTNASFCQFLDSMAKTPSPEPAAQQEVQCMGSSMSRTQYEELLRFWPSATSPLLPCPLGSAPDLKRLHNSSSRFLGSFPVPLSSGHRTQEPSDVLRPMFVREAPGNDDGTGSVDSASLLPPCTNSSAPLRSQEAANPSSNDRKPDSAAANQRVHPSEDAPESCVGKQWKGLDAGDHQKFTASNQWHEAIASLFEADDAEEQGASKDCSEGEEFQDDHDCTTAVTPAEAAALPSKELLQSVYHLPILQAAAALKVGLGTLKRGCRLHDIGRWPYRKFNSLDKLIRSVCDCSELDPLGADHVIRGLIGLKDEVYRNPRFQFDGKVKKLRQANFKMQYKKRTQAGKSKGHTS